MRNQRLRTIAWTVALVAPIAALIGAGVDELAARRMSRRAPVAKRPSIHDVPSKPALWGKQPRRAARFDFDSLDVSPVGVENPHAPPTPPLGIPMQRRA